METRLSTLSLAMGLHVTILFKNSLYIVEHHRGSQLIYYYKVVCVCCIHTRTCICKLYYAFTYMYLTDKQHFRS
jgi:hypothetical protein